jgi:capsular exopolysaccharide synthesis family protein
LNLRELAAIVWKRRYLVLLVVVLCVLFGAVFAFTKGDRYESKATVSITPDVETQGFVPAENLSAVLGNYAETAESSEVREQAEQELGRPLDADVNATNEAGTAILEISARADGPVAAQEAAQAVTDAFVDVINPKEQFVTVDIIDPAKVPDGPVQPQPPLIVAASIIVGLGAAILLALAVDRLRRRIETSDDLAEVTNLPLLTQVPRNRALARGKAPKLVWDDPGMLDLQETFRSLRTNLAFVAEGKPPAILITSAGVGAGKTTTVANVGVAFAQMGVKTAIVDADLRRPAQHRVFGVDSPPWAQNPEPDDPGKGRETRFPNLYVLPAGPPVADPAGVLHVAFGRMLDSLRDSFEVILIDSPPVLPVSDAKITARWVDTVVLVVAARTDKPSSVARSIEELRIAEASIKGVVLNRTAETVGGFDYYRPAVLDGEGADRSVPAMRSGSTARDES